MNLRDYERETIRRFVQSVADEGFFRGQVLDYGSGKEPYRGIVEAAGAEYVPYDRATFGGAVNGTDVGEKPLHPDVVLCTQVIQYVHFPQDTVREWKALLRESNHGHLVLSWPTNWPEVEDADLWRFTKAGMRRMLEAAGFEILSCERRGVVYDPQFEWGSAKRLRATGEEFALGYGVVAKA